MNANPDIPAQNPPKVVLPNARKQGGVEQGEPKQEARTQGLPMSRFQVDSMIQDFEYVLAMNMFSYKEVLESEGMDMVYKKIEKISDTNLEGEPYAGTKCSMFGWGFAATFEDEVKKLISHQVGQIAAANGTLSTRKEEIERRGVIGVLQAMKDDEREAFTRFAEIDSGLRNNIKHNVLKGSEEIDEKTGQPKMSQKQENQANRMANDTYTVIRNQVPPLKDIRPDIEQKELAKLPEEERKRVVAANTLLTRFSRILHEYLTLAEGIRNWEKAVRQNVKNAAKRWEVLVDSFWPVEVEKPEKDEKPKSGAPAKKGAGKKVASKGVGKSPAKKSAKKKSSAKKGGKKK